jgi:alkanesulfonate monooxygenase SsuD/methylene tetrahydromethanopterin reductase-like flavin-dependent oxidoreductase (luciferase family)
MEHPIRVGIKFSGQDCTADQMRTVWQAVDECGFDHLWAFDHLASIGSRGSDRPVFEGWSMAAAMAIATRKVRFGLNVTGNTYRHPAVLAKIAVTVDHLSGGRLEFGIGAAWNELEHSMYGIEGLDHRVGRLSESLHIISGLWTEERVSFAGRYYRVEDAIGNPKPVQKPYPPIWIGAGGEMMMKLVARYADVWNPTNEAGANVDAARAASAKLDALCEGIGRDPQSIRRALQVFWDGKEADKLVQHMAGFAGIGFSEFLIAPLGGDPVRAVEVAARDVVPRMKQRG